MPQKPEVIRILKITRSLNNMMMAGRNGVFSTVGAKSMGRGMAGGQSAGFNPLAILQRLFQKS